MPGIVSCPFLSKQQCVELVLGIKPCGASLFLEVFRGGFGQKILLRRLLHGLAVTAGLCISSNLEETLLFIIRVTEAHTHRPLQRAWSLRGARCLPFVPPPDGVSVAPTLKHCLCPLGTVAAILIIIQHARSKLTRLTMAPFALSCNINEVNDGALDNH